ncbi:MAG: carbohydrate ABC transporter permease [Candidatus Bipolaricaulia bacterium]
MVNLDRSRKMLRRLALYGGVTLFLFVALFPFLWVLVSSLHPTADLLQGRVRIPIGDPTFDHYLILFRAQYGVKVFSRFILNSLKVGLGTAALTMLIAALAAYGLSRYRLRGGESLSRMMLFIYIFPISLALMPIFELLARLKLLDTHLGLILIHTALAAPFCTWLLRSFFDAIPRELEEAAAVDGASRFQAFVRILIPVTAPGLLTAGVYALVISWGEYTFAANLLISGAKWTAPLGLATYMTEQAIEWGQLLAGTILTAIPLMLIFLPLARYFLKGFLEGAIR